MCAPCCPAGAQRMQSCQRPEKLVMAVPKERKCCTAYQCAHCKTDTQHACRCSCHRNQAILYSLAMLFRCRIQYVMSTLCRLALLETQSCHRNGRALERVKAPYTEAEDLAINDSIYDRCGEFIDPLDQDNAHKVMRLLFLAPVLKPGQYSSLVWMLQKLNVRVKGAVDLNWLVYTVATLRLGDFVCAFIRQDARAARLYNAQLCLKFCQPQGPVQATEEATKAPRKRKRDGKGKARGKATSEACARKRADRNAPVYCTRRPVGESTLRYSGSPSKLPGSTKSPGDFSTASAKDSRRASKNSNGSGKRTGPEFITVGVRMQGGTPWK
ncbi:uncharacterized protein LOC108161440 [Drosophila miranda]|uniref:uncharacterized protein LOC108161440 n=1 Tax=Drosophila miranda TaxID=7229 RepID=UPI0007E89D4F|nr:uncharacterized protein LOC108161440 [Drosophila miranda]